MAEDNNSKNVQHHHHHHHRHHKRRRKFWRIFWIVIGVVVVVGIFVAGMMYKNLRDTTNSMYIPVAKSTSNKGRNLDTLLKEKKPINILLLGIDTGEFGRTYKGRTDTIMMMTINPKKETSTIVSVPRDSAAIFPDFKSYGVTKINSAYTLGGVSETIKTLDKYYSVPIDGYLLVNMNGLEKAINQVGGVNITSNLTFTNEGYTFVKGKTYHMNGKKALAFSRERHADPKSDYGRQERQRMVVTALLKKTASPTTLLNSKFLNSMADEMQTDLTMNQMYKIAVDYRKATNHTVSDHAQGVSKSTNNVKFGEMEIEVVSQKERQRVSDKLRSALDLAKKKVIKNDY